VTRRGGDLDVYDSHASAWWDFTDPVFLPLYAMVPARARYLDRHGIHVDNKRALDVGCGGGYVSELLAKRGAKVIAFDLAKGAVRAGKQKLGDKIAWLCASATEIPLKDESVDVVVNTDVLVHLTDPLPCLREMSRVLKPGGVLWFSTINKTALARFVLITLGENILKFVRKGTHDAETFIAPSRMKAHLADVAIELQHVEGVGPIRVDRRLDLVMGRLPTCAVMYQGHGIKHG
jgi:2-polyprenyl-6-hydroxyphenyl methylase / 3-demethylubiquinone-9 3-methyltransferase